MSVQNRPELAIAALISMLSRYSFVRCPAMVLPILDHLRHIADDERCDEALRQTAARLYDEWGGARTARTAH
jgi:hypothetical protein